MMAAALRERIQSQWGKKTLAILLVAMILLISSCLALSVSQTPAGNKYQIQSEGVAGETRNDDSANHEAYNFSNQELLDARINHWGAENNIVIPGHDVPLFGIGQTGQASGSSGSILNFLLAMLCMVSVLVMLLFLLVRKSSDYRVIRVRTLVMTFGLVAVVLWSFLDRRQIPSVITNEATISILAVFGVFIVMATATYLYEYWLNRKNATEQ